MRLAFKNATAHIGRQYPCNNPAIFLATYLLYAHGRQQLVKDFDSQVIGMAKYCEEMVPADGGIVDRPLLFYGERIV